MVTDAAVAALAGRFFALDIPLFASKLTDDATSDPGGENWEQEGFFKGPLPQQRASSIPSCEPSTSLCDPPPQATSSHNALHPIDQVRQFPAEKVIPYLRQKKLPISLPVVPHKAVAEVSE